MKDEYKKQLTIFRKNKTENTEEYREYITSDKAKKDSRGKGFSQKAQGQFKLAIQREKEEALEDLHEETLDEDSYEDEQYEQGLRIR